MKILFLDCDGVLNCKQTFIDHKQMDLLDTDMVERVRAIVKQTGCKVVLSSSWRNHKDSTAKINRRIKLLDSTPNCRSGFRGDEIKAWLEQHPEVDIFACLDDDSDFYPDQHLFQTSFNEGLTDSIMQQIIKYLTYKI